MPDNRTQATLLSPIRLPLAGPTDLREELAAIQADIDRLQRAVPVSERAADNRVERLANLERWRDALRAQLAETT